MPGEKRISFIFMLALILIIHAVSGDWTPRIIYNYDVMQRVFRVRISPPLDGAAFYQAWVMASPSNEFYGTSDLVEPKLDDEVIYKIKDIPKLDSEKEYFIVVRAYDGYRDDLSSYKVNNTEVDLRTLLRPSVRPGNKASRLPEFRHPGFAAQRTGRDRGGDSVGRGDILGLRFEHWIVVMACAICFVVIVACVIFVFLRRRHMAQTRLAASSNERVRCLQSE